MDNRKLRPHARCVLLLLACFLSVAGVARGQQAQSLARPLKFTDEAVALPYAFRRSTPGDPYLTKLRTSYELDGVVAGQRSDYDKVRAVSRWVRSRWEHNGDNEPRKADPISILQEAAEGKRFRCVEYSIVVAAALNSIGVPARVLALKTEDVETRESGAGHVVAEAYLTDAQKWIMVDGQWDVIPTLKGRPLNAVELQDALARRAKGLSVESFSGARADEYFKWVAPYLFYFDVRFDSRYEVERQPHSLMLVPVGAKEPAIFQKKWPLKNMIYTRSRLAFYAKPA